MSEVVRVDESQVQNQGTFQDWSTHLAEDGDSLFTLVDWDGAGKSDEVARINSDGTCMFNWELIARAAARWSPDCANLAVSCVKLLHEAKRQGEIRVD